ncbi:MAG: hypothetical protein U5K29_14715 [Acidimicrobiales bacterium]|nr:hypothetical protein [Acidimicrobiales bacterium]
MTRVYTAVDLEELAADGWSVLSVAPGEVISPAALDVAAARGIEVRRGASIPDAVDDDVGSDVDAHACSCGESDEVTAMLRDVVQSVAASRPGADASTVAEETLKALGAHGAHGVGSPIQAMPAGDRVLPAKAKGARPVFFDDGGALDAVISMLTTLASETWAMRERLDTLERLLVAKGALAADAVESYRPDDAVLDEREAAASAFAARVFRVFEEMREQTMADETWDEYMEVVRRAFAEL